MARPATSSGFAWRSTLLVALAYTLITIVMTWPVAIRAATDAVPDFGDSLLNAWILGWNGTHLLGVLRGDAGAMHGYWDANIFHPEPLTLTYSEHLFAQALQGLPVYAATGNLLLTHNVLFLSTFVLSALGVYLLVRDLTGHAGAAFVAGLLYGFAPYRINQFTHLQVLSSQWMPFVIFSLRRFFVTRAWRYVAVATATLVLQNLSCGYYLVFFAPFVLLYAIYEICDRGLWRVPRVWAGLAAAGLVTATLTWPFVAPYLEARAHGQGPRPRQEVETFSADVYAYLTASPLQRVWGQYAQVYPRPEGELFPGLVPVALAAIGLFAAAAASQRSARATASSTPTLRWWVTALALGFAALQALAFVAALLSGGGTWRIGGTIVRTRGLIRPLTLMAVSGLLALAMSPRVRAFVRGRRGSLAGFSLVALALAIALSFGPTIRARGRIVSEGPYDALHAVVPGYDGLRVPARHAMIASLFLAVLGGLGADALRRRAVRGGAVLALVAVAFLVEASPVPVPTNETSGGDDLARLPDRVAVVQPPPAYAYLASLPRGTVVAELPFGNPGYELRYVYYSAMHWHPLVNGYSGQFPRSYALRASYLSRPLSNPNRAWSALVEPGTTHVVLHEWAYLGDGAASVRQWLSSHGARPVATFGQESVWAIPH
jgi:hypothetical protein